MKIGLEILCHSQHPSLQGKRLGLLCNQASTDHLFIHSRDRITQAYPGQLRCLFSPQHGFFSEKQDNMIESGDAVDPVTQLSVYSLYGDTRKPTPEMFADIDVLLVDLIDVGTRVYTFIWTVAYCLQTAAETGVKVVILDRPNPIGGHIQEGNMLNESCISFVGLMSIPMRHGLTIGEMAMFCNSEMAIDAELEVVKVKDWHRKTLAPQTGFPWIYPSPNMPSFLTAMVYPGQVLWEGTNISEGRGTTLPFELFGAPFIDHEEVVNYLQTDVLEGCILRPLSFEPTSGKWAGTPCHGFHLHVTNYSAYRPYRTSLALLQACIILYPEAFQYKEPPYEYEYEKLPMDLIIGDRGIRKALEEGRAILELEQSWQQGLAKFVNHSRSVLLYE